MTNDDLADAHLADAFALVRVDRDRHARGICSRAYYSAYARISARAPAHVVPKTVGWTNFDHEQVRGLLSQIGLDATDRTRLIAALDRLKDARTDADYHPDSATDGDEARERLRDLATIHAALR